MLAGNIHGQFSALVVDTSSTIPLGTIVSLEVGNLLFQNIPPATADPLVDFFIPYLSASSSVSVPEPTEMVLLLFAVVVRVSGEAGPHGKSQQLINA